MCALWNLSIILLLQMPFQWRICTLRKRMGEICPSLLRWWLTDELKQPSWKAAKVSITQNEQKKVWAKKTRKKDYIQWFDNNEIMKKYFTFHQNLLFKTLFVIVIILLENVRFKCGCLYYICTVFYYLVARQYLMFGSRRVST